MTGEVGIQPNKGIIDSSVGSICLKTRDIMLQWQQIFDFFSAQTDAQLLTLGYDNEGVIKCRSLQQRAGELVGVISGNGTILLAHDYMLEMSQWWGHGFLS